MKKVLFFALMSAALSSCSVAPMIKSASSFAVKEYCALPLPARMVIRSELNSEGGLAPNSIEITCWGPADGI